MREREYQRGDWVRAPGEGGRFGKMLVWAVWESVVYVRIDGGEGQWGYIREENLEPWEFDENA